MKVALLTYDTKHLKTALVYQYLSNFKNLEISFLGVPFTRRKEREVVFVHRPYQFTGIDSRTLASTHGNRFYEYEERNEVLKTHDYLVICGANILESKFANSRKIINCHSGIIPNVRGLDSFKWAVLEGQPVGNTLHIIDEQADSGKILTHLKTPIYKIDSLETFARRHYNNEIWLLSHFFKYLNGEGHIISVEERKARMRMPIAKEKLMIEAFESYKIKYVNKL